jgi:SM-20-related protein
MTLSEKARLAIPQAISYTQAEALRGFAKSRWQAGAFRPAQIGRGVDKALVTEIRSDQIFWLDTWQEQVLEPMHALLSSLLVSFNRELFLGLRRFESQLARYGEGSLYLRHRDRHQGSPNRWVTVVLYLNTLEPNQGGEILLHLDDGSIYKERPEAGKMLIFLSELEHEVLPLLSGERWSLTTWFRTDQELA